MDKPIQYSEIIEKHMTNTRDYLTKEIDNIFDNVIPKLSDGDKLLLTKELEIKCAAHNYERAVNAARSGKFSPLSNVCLSDRIKKLPVTKDVQGNVLIQTTNFEDFADQFSQQAYLNSIDSASITHSKFMEYKKQSETAKKDFIVQYQYDKIQKNTPQLMLNH